MTKDKICSPVDLYDNKKYWYHTRYETLFSLKIELTEEK